jgi:acetyl esterase/lipase
MNPTAHRRFTLLLAALALAAATRAQVPAAKLDRDGDGKISRAEFTGDPAIFAKLDRNADGFLSGDELRGPGGDGTKAERAPRTAAGEPAGLELQADIVYKTVGGEKIALDLYRLKGRRYENAPLAIWIHGGGYVKGDKEGAVRGNAAVFGPLMEQHGYLVASLNYRLCTLDGPKVPDCTTDCKDAVRFLVKNAATFGFDPARIVVLGASAGGGLALLVALTADGDFAGAPELAGQRAPVRAAVSYFGVTDFAHKSAEFARGDEKLPILFRPGDRDDARLLASVSPVSYLSGHKAPPPMLLVHGELDPVVPYSQSVWMDAEAKRLGVPMEFVRVKNMRHGFQPGAGGTMAPALDDIWRATVDFVVKHNPPAGKQPPRAAW